MWGKLRKPYEDQRIRWWHRLLYVQCPICWGTGIDNADRCPRCEGVGFVRNR